MKIAKIVSSNSHILYIARVLEERDGEGVPGADDYGFGKFVAVPLEAESIVGVICDSRLVNPEYMNYSPRTAPMPALGELKRELTDEQKALVGILLLGSLKADGTAVHEIPQRVVPAGSGVHTMEPDDVGKFHMSGGAVHIHYFPNLLANAGQLAVPLAKRAIEQLHPHCSETDRQRLAVMANALSWKHTFGSTNY